MARDTARFFSAGYDSRSLIAFALLVTVAGSVGYRWSDLVDTSGNMDWLLGGIWVVMGALIIWKVDARRDVVLIVTGLGGGLVIEWWGTTTELWRYFTNERPPPWILPAWPCAAIAIDRLGALLDRALGAVETHRAPFSTRTYVIAYWSILPPFVVWMTWFLSPAAHRPASMVVIAIMIGVALSPKDHRRDVVLFAAGTTLGVFLEYWGTSRECWTYYTEQTPPPVAVVAHGFAAIAFARVADFMVRALERTLKSESPKVAGSPPPPH